MKRKTKINAMENKYFPLSAVENNRLIKIIQIVFGIACLAVACFWLSFNIKTLKSDNTLWITIVFLSGFGFYMVWAGLGKAARFIDIRTDKLLIKKTILLPALEIPADSIQKIELFSFSIKFFLKNKNMILRLSSSFYETNAKIKDEIWEFAESNSIPVELIEEKV
jgi:hypothetical protein